MFIQSTNTAAMEKAMNAAWQRIQLISTNIANEDTPGYKAKRLSFEAALQAELDNIKNSSGVTRREAVGRINSLEPYFYDSEATITRADGNNVDILAEQNELAKAQYLHQALSQKISGHYSNLKYAISGGR